MTPPRELLDLIEDVYKASRDLGFIPAELYTAQAPWQLRADAWCHRVDRLLGEVSVPKLREVAA
jgi:hypothetical protein